MLFIILSSCLKSSTTESIWFFCMFQSWNSNENQIVRWWNITIRNDRMRSWITFISFCDNILLCSLRLVFSFFWRFIKLYNVISIKSYIRATQAMISMRFSFKNLLRIFNALRARKDENENDVFSNKDDHDAYFWVILNEFNLIIERWFNRMRMIEWEWLNNFNENEVNE
jgi:magnesium-transporting ATPase (P-type)